MVDSDNGMSLPPNEETGISQRPAGLLSHDPSWMEYNSSPRADVSNDSPSRSDVQDIPRDLPEKQSRVKSPIKPAGSATPRDSAIEDDESDLSELGDTPPRPNELGRTSPPPAEVECRHTTWCDCPMHASYASGKRFPHLSEWALSQMQFPESYNRTDLLEAEYEQERSRRKAGEDAQLRKRVISAQEWAHWLTAFLPTMAFADPDDVRNTARHFVESVSCYYPPQRRGVGDEAAVIEQVGRAVADWRKDMKYGRLEQRVGELVRQKKDVMFLFQQFLPLRFLRVTKREAEEASQMEGATYGWPGAEELDKARRRLG